MNRPTAPRPSHLTSADLRGVGTSLRKIYTIADDGSFDRLLGRLDHAASSHAAAAGGRRS